MATSDLQHPADYRLEKWISFILALLFFLPFVARAGEIDPQHPIRLADVQSPTLLIKTSRPGLYLEAPAVKSDIAIEVRGVVARGTLKQTFTNPTSDCIEAIYAFPLPENATVDTLRMTVGGRVIEGEIRERAAAREQYEQARTEGRQASLVEQARPNLFTVSVSSIGAGMTAAIELQYQQTVAWDSGSFSLRVPLAIGPRYTPNVTDRATSPSTPPMPALNHIMPSQPGHPHNPVDIVVDLDAGIPLREITSSTHVIEKSALSGTRWQIRLSDPSTASDHDFELVWSPQLGAEPKTAVFTETAGGSRYSLMMVFPPDARSLPHVVMPRETVFIIDTSGSMEGPSLTQAKKALLFALDRLQPSDFFNVIEFNSAPRPLYSESRPAGSDNIRSAKAFVESLRADGGTEMLPALRLALEPPPITGALRQVIFMTDGQVSNEAELVSYLRTHLGEARLFTMGIGSAPNSYFMREAARAGRGTFTYAGNIDEVEKKMSDLFSRIESPVLSDVEVKTAGANAELWPQRIPDLYAGEPVVITARTPVGETHASLHGRIAASDWDREVSIDGAEQPGIAKLWARQKIDALTDRLNGQTDGAEVKRQIVATALEHHLVTSLTSLVAVDMTPPSVDPATCQSRLIPLDLPAGWTGGEGSLPQTGTSGRLWMLLGVLLAAVAWTTRFITD